MAIFPLNISRSLPFLSLCRDFDIVLSSMYYYIIKMPLFNQIVPVKQPINTLYIDQRFISVKLR